MERLLPVLLIVLIVIALPTLAQAEDQPVPGGSGQGSAGIEAGDMDMSGSGSGSPGEPGYKPVESRADDGGMAALVALVFGFPVVVWLIVRTIKKSARSRRSTN